MSENLFPSEEYRNHLQSSIIALSQLGAEDLRCNPLAKETFSEFRYLLNKGIIRAAEKSLDGKWEVNTWVKEGILAGFRMGEVVSMSGEDESLQFFDRETFPIKKINGISDRVRVVPGGTSVRDGVHLEGDNIIMPPSFINVAAYIGRGTMIDSHVLVGSCAQVGRDCHIAMDAQIGGVLEPVGAMPCIVEDNVFMGGKSAIAEGVILGRGVGLSMGTVIHASMPVIDLVNEARIKPVDGQLIIPPYALVKKGTIPSETEYGREIGVQMDAAIITKYYDPLATNARTAINEDLR